MNLLKSNISNDQRRKIYALAKDAKLSNEKLHEFMPDWSGAVSLAFNKCTSAQANKIIEALQKITDKKPLSFGEGCPKGGVGHAAGRPGSATEKQLNAINKIAECLGWNHARLNGFITHTIGREIISHFEGGKGDDNLTAREATAVITGLKQMEKSKTKQY